MLDVIGIGVGPFDLSLAALLDKHTHIRSKFFEQKGDFSWHESMIFPHTTLQVPFMADLVTLIDPTSKFTFLNYLHVHHRLLKFYFIEDFEIYRQEYNHYCQWVAHQLNNLVFNATVVDVSFIDDSIDNNADKDTGSVNQDNTRNNLTTQHSDAHKVPTPQQGFNVTINQNGETKTYQTKNIVVGTGTRPLMPDFLQNIANQAPHRCMHTAQFSTHFDLERIQRKDIDNDALIKVLVIGSGQSAAEVYVQLFDHQLDDDGKPKYQLDWMTRSAGFFPMEYAPLGLEHFSPSYIDYFHKLKDATKAEVIAKQDLLHKGMDFGTIRDIYYRLYERSIGNKDLHTNIMGNTELLDAELIKETEKAEETLRLTFNQHEQESQFSTDYDCIIAGTGYQDSFPPCLDSLLPYLAMDDNGNPRINRDYTLVYKDEVGSVIDNDKDSQTGQDKPSDIENKSYKAYIGKVFVQNKETHTHGVGAGDLGLGAYRAGYIINKLAGKKIYDTDALQTFQTFGVR